MKLLHKHCCIIKMTEFLDSFMKALERDAQERTEKKKAAKVKATVFKERGNTAFKSGDYLKAIELYTQVHLLHSCCFKFYWLIVSTVEVRV